MESGLGENAHDSLNESAAMSATPEFSHSATDLLRYEPFVRSIARALLSDEDRVGDVVQETWLRALTKQPTDTGAFKGWLGRIARNLAMDQYRRESNIRHRERRAARNEAVESDERDLELHGKVVQAVLDLDEPYKTVVMLHYYRGLNLAQVAKELNRNAATVRSQLHRAHELLKGKMDGQFEGDRASWMTLCLPLAATRTTLLGSLAYSKVAVALLLIAAAITTATVLTSEKANLGQRGTQAAMIASPNISQTTGMKAQVPLATRSDQRTPIVAGNSILVTLRGAPVEGADVWRLLISDTTSDHVRNNPVLSSDPEKVFRQLGQHSLTGKDGRASLNSVDEDFAILVMKGAYLRIVKVDQVRAHPLEAQLEKGVAMNIKTVDTRGIPIAGIPIILRAAESETDSDGNRSLMMRDMLTRTSSPKTGAVSFCAMEQFFPSFADRSWSVRIGIPGAASHQTQVDVERSLDDPIVLTVDDTGSMSFRTVDEDGELLELQGTAYLRSAGLEQASVAKKLVNGIAHFPLVGVGSRLKLSIVVPEYGTTWSSDQQGPNQAGETKTVVIHRPDSPSLSGDVVGANGEPLASAQLKFCIVGEENEHFMPIQVETNQAGRFHIELEPDLARPERSIMLLQYGRMGIEAYASSDDALQLAIDTKSLGKFVMHETAGFIEGVCLTPDGNPLPDIHVAVGCVGGYRDTHYTTGPDGRFYLGGVFPPEPALRIEEGGDWVLANAVAVTPGQRDVELTLTRGGSIKGTLVSGEGPYADQVILSASLENELGIASTTPSGKTTADRATGEFRLGGLRSGMYTVLVQLQSEALGAVTIRTLEHVAVLAPNTSTDPRVALIDLGEEVCSIRFKITGTEGNPLAARRVAAIVIASGEEIANGVADTNGHVVLTYPKSDDATIRIEAAGYRSKSFDAQAVPTDVVLLPGISVELLCDQRPKVRSKDAVHLLSLHRVEGDATTRDKVALPSTLARDGACEITFPAAGRYQLFYSVHNINPHHGPSEVGTDRAVPGKFFIDVPDSKTRASIQIELPAEMPE